MTAAVAIIGAQRVIADAAADAIAAMHGIDKVLASLQLTVAERDGKVAVLAALAVAQCQVDVQLEALEIALCRLRGATDRRRLAAGLRIDRRIGLLLDAGIALAKAGDGAEAVIAEIIGALAVMDGKDVLRQRRAAVAADRRIAAARADLASVATFAKITEAARADAL